MFKNYLFSLILLALVACAPTIEPDANQGSKKIIKADTNEFVIVDSIELLILESYPVQVNAIVKGHLVDGCVVLNDMIATRSDSAFAITIDAIREGDICTDALVPFEKTVALDVVQLAAGTYTIAAGQQSAQFTLNEGDTGTAAVDFLDGTEWSWLWGRYDEKNMETYFDRKVTLQFKDGQISGNAGCNSYFAPYTLNGDTFTLGVVGSTRKACAKDIMQIEGVFLLALGAAETISQRGGELQIDHVNGHLNFLTEKPIETTLFIAAELADCTAVSEQTCMHVRYAPTDSWQFFYDGINGFTFEPGYETELRVRISPQSNPPMDGSMFGYELLELVSKTPIAP